MPELKREKIKKIVLVTHPRYHRLEHPKEFRPDEGIREIKAIVSKCKKEPGTHFVVSWNKKEAKKKLRGFMKRALGDRLHEPGYGKEIEYSSNIFGNFIGHDKETGKKLAKIGFEKEIEIESYGNISMPATK